MKLQGNVSQKRKHKLKETRIYFRLIRPSASSSRRIRSSIQLNEQESTEGHLGKSLSCGNNHFHDFNKNKIRWT
jgi:hypothetical protein